MKKTHGCAKLPVLILVSGLVLGVSAELKSQTQCPQDASVAVSKCEPRYFVEGGKPWIPVGCNICFDRNANSSAKARELFDGWMTKFAANGGNFMRVWLSVPFVDVMPEKACEFSNEATDNLKWLGAPNSRK